MKWYEATGAVAGIITLLILLGLAWALVRGSYNQARAKELREDNDDLRKRLGDAEAKIEAHELRESALEVKVEAQQTEINLLTSLVTQRADVEEVRTVMDDVLQALRDHHTAAENQWTEMNSHLLELIEKDIGT